MLIFAQIQKKYRNKWNKYTHTGFDEYYKSLRPRLTPEDCQQSMFVNQRHPHDPKLQINCRNIWFNEFWGQHHKCTFEQDSTLPRCTGNETLTNYEQEGLVPFVGNWHFIYYIKFFLLHFAIFGVHFIEFLLIKLYGKHKKIAVLFLVYTIIYHWNDEKCHFLSAPNLTTFRLKYPIYFPNFVTKLHSFTHTNGASPFLTF